MQRHFSLPLYDHSRSARSQAHGSLTLTHVSWGRQSGKVYTGFSSFWPKMTRITFIYICWPKQVTRLSTKCPAEETGNIWQQSYQPYRPYIVTKQYGELCGAVGMGALALSSLDGETSWRRLYSERQGLESTGSRRVGGGRSRAVAKDKKCELNGELPSLAEV